MKRIALISLVSLALFGCGEKKVTEEMLVGAWSCSATGQKAKWKNGMFQDYAPPVDIIPLLFVYLKEDGELFVESPYSDRKMKQDFKKLNGSHENSLGNMKILTVNKLEYISDNEFKLISEVTMIKQDKSEYNEKIKEIQHCIRIKITY